MQLRRIPRVFRLANLGEHIGHCNSEDENKKWEAEQVFYFFILYPNM